MKTETVVLCRFGTGTLAQSLYAGGPEYASPWEQLRLLADLYADVPDAQWWCIQVPLGSGPNVGARKAGLP